MAARFAANRELQGTGVSAIRGEITERPGSEHHRNDASDQRAPWSARCIEACSDAHSERALDRRLQDVNIMSRTCMEKKKASEKRIFISPVFEIETISIEGTSKPSPVDSCSCSLYSQS